MPTERPSRWLRFTAAAAATALAAGFAAEPKPPPATLATRRADPTLGIQRDIYFCIAGRQRQEKTFYGSGVRLWTDAPVKGKELAAHLEAVGKHLQAIAPAPPPATTSTPGLPRPVAVAIYKDAADYRQLWQRVGAWYGGRFGKVETEGFSYRVFCATSYGSAEQFASRRPVVCHEFAHVWLYQNRDLANDGNWLTEGLASAVQLRFFPNAGSRTKFLRWMDAGKMIPLKRLMDLERIATKDYWQAATLVETLLLHYRDSLPAVIAAHNRGDSAYAIVTKTLKTDFVALRKQWADHVRNSAKRQHHPPLTSTQTSSPS